MNSKGVTTKGGNFKIFDDKNILLWMARALILLKRQVGELLAD